MTQIDPIFAAVTAPGTPFEIGERDGMRCFFNAPPDLNMLIESARAHGEKTFIVDGARRLSFAETFTLRDALAAELGIARGDLHAQLRGMDARLPRGDAVRRSSGTDQQSGFAC